MESSKSYTELRAATKLSDRWLSKKLKELTSSGLITQILGKKYQLTNPTVIVHSDPVFAEFLQSRSSLSLRARLIAEELSRVEGVLAVVLFGSVAKGKATTESDIDLMIISESELEDRLNDTLYELMFRYDAPVEGLFLTYEELLMSLQEKSALALGILEAYRILYDRAGLEMLLALKKQQIQEEWTYDEEAEAWIRKSLLPTWRPRKNRRETQS